MAAPTLTDKDIEQFDLKQGPTSTFLTDKDVEEFDALPRFVKGTPETMRGFEIPEKFIFEKGVERFTDKLLKDTYGEEELKKIQTGQVRLNALMGRAPRIAFTYIQPFYSLGFEALQQAKNAVVSKFKGERYSPLETRILTELLPERLPPYIKIGSSIAEWVGEVALMGGLANIAKRGLLENTIREVGTKLEKAGYGTGKVTITKEAIKDAVKGTTLEQEAMRYLKAKGLIISPRFKLPSEEVVAVAPAQKLLPPPIQKVGELTEAIPETININTPVSKPSAPPLTDQDIAKIDQGIKPAIPTVGQATSKITSKEPLPTPPQTIKLKIEKPKAVRGKKLIILPNKEELLSQIEEAIKKAPSDKPPEDKATVFFQIDGGANIVNTKNALRTFYENVKAQPATESLKAIKPAGKASSSAKAEDVGQLRPLAIKGYYSDGRMFIKGEPPVGAKFTEQEPISKESIERILETKGLPAKKLYYYIADFTVDLQGVSAGPIAYSKTAKFFPLVVFESGGKYYHYNQFKFNHINKLFPGAEYYIEQPDPRINKIGGILIAKVNRETVAILMPLVSPITGERAAMKEPPLKEFAIRKGLVEGVKREIVGKSSEGGFILSKALHPSEYVYYLDKVFYDAFGRKLEKGFFSLLDRITPEVIKRNIVEQYKQPEAYKKLVDLLSAERANQAEIVKNTATELAKYKPEELKNIRQYIESGEYPDTDLGRLARKVEDIFFDLGKQLVQYGLLTPQQFGKYADKYFPYYHRIFNNDGTIGRWFKRRLDLSYAKHRKDIPEEWRQAAGIIDNTPEPIARKMIVEMGDIALQKFFTAISQNPELSSPTAIGDFIQLPKNKKLGALSEVFVHPAIADDLKGMVYTPQLADDIATKLISLWKMGKVVLNPPTVGRNILTNFLMADVVGDVPIEDAVSWIKGASSLSSKDNYYQLLKNQGKIGIEFYRGEIQDIIDNFKTEKNPIRIALNVLKKGGEYYSLMEEWAKVTIFRKNMEDGKPVEEAAQLAEDAIFNYSKVAPLIRQLRQGRGQGPLGPFGTIMASPFITFRAKVLKALSHAAFKKPFTILKYVLLFTAISAVSKKMLGISNEKVKKIQNAMQERGRYGLLTPWVGRNGENYLVDLTFILPIFGDFLEFQAKIAKRGLPQALQSTFGIFGNPLITIPAQVTANYDFYKNQPIASQFENKYIKWLDFIWQQSMPPLLSKAGWDILKGQDPLRKSLSLVGLRTIPYNEKEQREYKIRRLKGLQFNYNLEKGKINKDKDLSPTQKVKQGKELLRRYLERRRGLLRE